MLPSFWLAMKRVYSCSPWTADWWLWAVVLPEGIDTLQHLYSDKKGENYVFSLLFHCGCVHPSTWVWCSVNGWEKVWFICDVQFDCHASKDEYSLKDNFLTCNYCTFSSFSVFSALNEYFISSCVQVGLYILVFRFITMLCPCFCDKHMSMLLSCMWYISISSLGLRDCLLTSAMLSLAKFQKVLSDLFSGHSKVWWIPFLLFQILEHIFPSSFPSEISS